MANIEIKDLSRSITDTLQRYSEEVSYKLEVVKKDTAKESAAHLRAGKKPYRYGHYAASWTYKKDGTAYVVHNKKHYQLTHLLEHGHAKINGGRVDGIPHIKPVEIEAAKIFVRGIERVLRK